MRLLFSLRSAVAFLFFPLALLAESAPTAGTPKSVQELRARLDAHIGQPRFSGALWGVKIVSRESGRTLFEHHADRLMSPASNSKLYTAALALNHFGSDYRIITPILASAKPDASGRLNGDLIISGRGDPSWNSRTPKQDFWATFAPFITAVKNAGVRQISGDIVGDATWFHSLPNGSGWTADDLNDDYGAEISAITLEDNYAELRLYSGDKIGDPCHIAWLQPLTGVTLVNRTTTVATGRAAHVVSRRVFGESAVYLFGELPLRGPETIIEVTVPRPATWFASALRDALIRAGISVEGKARSVRWPEPPVVTAASVKLGEIVSPPLRDLVRGFMKPSQNLETDLIFAHLGESLRTAAAPAWRTSEDLAVAALREFLRSHQLPADEVRFEEGSGLSRNNLTSANATVALLKLMATHGEAVAFGDSLPVAGVDGTLRRRMQGTPAEGNVRAKTGSLRYANALSGYVTTAAGEPLIFSVMLNRNSQQPAGRNVREELEDIAVLLAGFTGRSEAASTNQR